jgi:hypothetical protein
MKQLVLLVLTIFVIITASSQTIKFPPTPNEDSINGKNDNCYLSAVNHPTATEKEQFIHSIRAFVDSVCNKEQLPANTVLAMAIAESGYGFTRTAYYANNLFGIKVFTRDSSKAYVLRGQPSEGVNNKTLQQWGANRIIFDESLRVDNRYRVFKNRQASIEYLVYKILLAKRYIGAAAQYRESIRNNTLSEREAALQYAYQIADKGYNHLGGKYYRKGIEKIFNTLNL